MSLISKTEAAPSPGARSAGGGRDVTAATSPPSDPRALLVPILNLAERAAEFPVEIIPTILVALASLQMSLSAQLLAQGLPSRPPDNSTMPDRLLTAVEAAPLLSVSARWLYRHAGRLPFTRRLARKALRFSEVAIQRYMASKKA